MGKSSPATPAAPDPVQTANAQSQSNINTANATASLNHTNQYTPWGSQVYSSKDNADGTKQWTSNITLSPEQQKLLDAQNGQSLGLSNLATSQMGNVSNALANPIDFNKASGVQNNPLVSNVNGTKATAGQIQNSIAGAGNIQTRVANSGGIQGNVADAGKIQTTLDTKGVPALVGGDALAGAMKDNQGAAYNQQAAYLDTSYGRRQRDLENQLVQQGVTQNSDAWNRAMGSLGEQRTFDYNNAFNNSFSTGLAANNQLYNQGLSSNQNAFGQALSSGNFANSAQAQQYGQNANNMTQANAAQAQQYGQNANNMTMANAAQAQQFGQNAAQGAFANTAQQQAYGQSSNDANTAFSQGLANAGLNNQTSAQAFAQSSADRARQLQEQSQQQQIPLNLLNALRTGSQVTSPSFGGTPQGNVGGTDIASMYNNQYQGQLAGYNGQIATNNANTTAGAGVAAAAMIMY